MMNQEYRSVANLFTLQYPRLWEYEEIDGIPAFFDPLNGKGALQIFAYDRTRDEDIENTMQNFPFLNGKSLTDKMNLFLFSQGVDISDKEIKEYRFEDVLLCPCEYRLNDRFYMAAMLEKNTITVLALYNSEGDPQDEEAKIVGEIIRSIHIQ